MAIWVGKITGVTTPLGVLRFKLVDTMRDHLHRDQVSAKFWIHRYLDKQGISNFVVDSSSIEVNRRSRRAKTDRIDVGKLMDMLIRYTNGEQKLWSVVHVPSVEQEDQRRIQREIDRLKKERTAHSNRYRLIGEQLKLIEQEKEQLLQHGGPAAKADRIRRSRYLKILGFASFNPICDTITFLIGGRRIIQYLVAEDKE